MVGYFIIYTGCIGAPIVWYSAARRHDGLPSSWRRVMTASLQADGASRRPPSSWRRISSWRRVKTASFKLTARQDGDVQADGVLWRRRSSWRPISSWRRVMTASLQADGASWQARFKLTVRHDTHHSSWRRVMTAIIQADGASRRPPYKLTAHRDGLPSIWRRVMTAFLQVDGVSWRCWRAVSFYYLWISLRLSRPCKLYNELYIYIQNTL